MSAVLAAVRQELPGLGASSAAAAIGRSPWQTPYQLYARLLGIEPRDPEDDDALQLEMGHALEPVAIRRFEKVTHFTVTDKQLRVEDAHWPRRWVTVDGLSSDGGYVEAKSTGFADPSEWGEEGTDEVPDHYKIQVQHGMACTGRPHAWIPLIISNRTFRIYRVERDQELIDLITELERDFVRRLDERDPPPPASLADVVSRWPSDSGRSITASAELEELARQHAAQREAEKAAKSAKEALQLKIASAMADASSLLDLTGKSLITYRQAKGSDKFDLEQFALEHPALYAKYLRTTPGSRRFLNKL